MDDFGQKLFEADMHRMLEGTHFVLYKTARRVVRLRKRGWKKLQTSRLYSTFRSTIDELNGSRPANPKVIEKFLKTDLQTGPIKLLRRRAYREGRVNSKAEFKNIFRRIWFQPLSQRINDCYFKHVFCGVLAANGVFQRCHNLVAIADFEDKRKITYGVPPDFYETSQGDVLIAALRFQITIDKQSYWKLISSLFVGTSPAFEMAIYSVHYLLENNPAPQIHSQHLDRERLMKKFSISGLPFHVVYNYNGEGKPLSAWPQF